MIKRKDFSYHMGQYITDDETIKAESDSINALSDDFHVELGHREASSSAAVRHRQLLRTNGGERHRGHLRLLTTYGICFILIIRGSESSA